MAEFCKIVLTLSSIAAQAEVRGVFDSDPLFASPRPPGTTSSRAPRLGHARALARAPSPWVRA